MTSYNGITMETGPYYKYGKIYFISENLTMVLKTN